jgi:Zc3h12a-like ribonuclease protein/S1 RNA binding family protein
VLDYKDMPIEHIVVDGSNIATEGRSLPSLSQLEEAVAELRRDHPNAEITVIVDATFAHRIDPSESSRFEQAAMRGEYVHPPAGAIGRGDAFLLRVAEKVDATVLSNDSFQEFHGEHPWLFERGRLLGATPVPGIGWIFSPRQPVRGPRSHQAVRETEQAKKRVTKAIAVATKEVVKPSSRAQAPATSSDGQKGRSRGGASAPSKAAGGRDSDKPTPLAVNDPLAFISFIAEHRLGEQLEGEVEGYTSHGAVVRVGEMRCYIPLANLGDPPPRSAREVLKRHQRAEFVLTALDPQRRGAELALPGIAYVSGHPRAETVAAEVRLAKPPRRRAQVSGPREARPARTPTARKLIADKTAAPSGRQPAKKAAAKALAAKAAVKAPASKAPAGRTPASKSAPSKAPAKRSQLVPAKRVPAKQVPATKKAAASKAPVRKAAVRKRSAAQAPATTTTGRTAATKKAVAGGGITKKASAGRSRPAPEAKGSVPAELSALESLALAKGRRSPRTAARTR